MFPNSRGNQQKRETDSIGELTEVEMGGAHPPFIHGALISTPPGRDLRPFTPVVRGNIVWTAPVPNGGKVQALEELKAFARFPASELGSRAVAVHALDEENILWCE